MPPIRPLRRRLVVSAIAVAAAVAAAVTAACSAGGSSTTAPPSAFGPESLVVTVSVAAETVVTGATFKATAVAHNETLKPIVATLQCPTVGLTLRIVNAAGQVVVSSNGGCTPGDPVRVATLQPDDSVIATLTGSTVSAGPLRVQAAYEAINGRSVVVEHALVVRDASTAPGPAIGCETNPSAVVFGLYVGVQDARTTASIAASSVVATEGTYREGLAPGPGTPGGPPAAYFGLADRPGTYTVTVTAPGYKDWRQDGVVVTRGACHVEPVRLVARLEPVG